MYDRFGNMPDFREVFRFALSATLSAVRKHPG
jgi:hypothetical protein